MRRLKLARAIKQMGDSGMDRNPFFYGFSATKRSFSVETFSNNITMIHSMLKALAA
jgi:hypothetical protein